MKYGCFDRPPFVPAYLVTGGDPDNQAHWIPTFGQRPCQFTLTALGQDDKRCDGCTHKKDANEQ